MILKGCKYNDLDKVICGPDVLFTPKETWSQFPIIENKEEIDLEKNSKMIAAAV